MHRYYYVRIWGMNVCVEFPALEFDPDHVTLNISFIESHIFGQRAMPRALLSRFFVQNFTISRWSLLKAIEIIEINKCASKWRQLSFRLLALHSKWTFCDIVRFWHDSWRIRAFPGWIIGVTAAGNRYNLTFYGFDCSPRFVNRRASRFVRKHMPNCSEWRALGERSDRGPRRDLRSLVSIHLTFLRAKD